MEKEILQELGFSEREAKVYLAMLELGETTVGPIASKTRIQHSKIYQTLEKLIDRGLVRFIIKSKTKYFSAQDPKQIINLLQDKERSFLEILPNLEKRKEFAKEQQVAIVYEGYKAIKTMFDVILDSLNKNSFYYVFAFRHEYIESDIAKNFLRQIHIKLAEKEVDDRLIAHFSVKKEFINNYGDIKNIKSRFTEMNLPLGLMIINNKVINWIWSERPTAIEIDSKQIAEQYRKFFLDIWKKTKK